MTLPSSGPLSMSQIVAEFGGSAPHSLSEYYRGGGLVPDIPANSAIPTSGPLSMSNFYGATAAGLVTLSGGTWMGGGFQSGAAGFNFGADGKVYTVGTDEGSAAYAESTDWIIPHNSANGTYEIRGVLASGNPAAVFGFLSADTWYTLDADRFFGGGISGSGPPFGGSITGTATIQIRKDGGSIIAQANYEVSVYWYDI